ncbi:MULTISPECIES: hypothetical protein [Citrobacter]|uniref:DUF5671 domain-containing protein n=3 Tax=Enterobacteriaceae TaxID=543 RepID=A0ABZ0H339_9ENTR|nr:MULTISPECIES: hypothetical protein [Citrobacter]MBJ8835772.1 hypothetical protein [Citrobacter freundii]MBJ9337055.1 hypothetical protein [Citrobacter freundii]MDE9576501.1 hypothetical protein [Citrobacter portucalensis]MDE9649927.1 hypothetical protein [Citrobacter portucalensis]MDE9665436.1 hypothetical protein [Citrobacter portucalensis]
MEKEELTYDVYERKFMGIANLSEVIIFIIIVYCVLSGTSLVKIYTYVTKNYNTEVFTPGIWFTTLGLTLIPISFIIVNGISPVQNALLSICKFKPRVKPSSRESEVVYDDCMEYMSFLAVSSGKLAKDVFNRGIIYLLVGIFFSIAGVLFFYNRVNFIKTPDDYKEILVILAPNFGVLFFIELVSFYFLKQYRSTMDEFRYYEAIKRSREENLATFKILIEKGKPEEASTIIEKISVRSQIEKLREGETSDIIESKKLEKGELEVLVKAIEALRPKS